MQTVAFLALLASVSALKRPSNADLMRMTLKSRGMSDVMLDMEASADDEKDDDPKMVDATKDDEATTGAKGKRVEGGRWAFGGLAISIVAMGLASSLYIKGPGAVEVQSDDGSQQSGWNCYNILVPIGIIFMSAFMFFSVFGSIANMNKKVDDQTPKTNVPGYEGKQVVGDAMNNPGERAFFASFALLAQVFIGFMICLYLRKQQSVQLQTSIIMKMGCRGAIAGILCTLFVEFIRLPFHDYMKEEELVVARVCVVLLWVAVVAIMEEVAKLALAFAGLKRRDDTEPSSIAVFLGESPQTLAICGLAAGIGFAFIENIPRMYAIACERPLAELQASGYSGSSTETALLDEETLRAGRIWTFVFWVLLNLQPWLTGLAAIQFAKITNKGPIVAPMDWFNALKFVAMVHFFFDLMNRSAHPAVEFLGCCAIPYAMYTFKKQWDSLASEDGDLLDDHQ